MAVFELDRSALEVGLNKLKGIWTDIPVDSVLKCVKGVLKESVLVLSSKNSEMIGVVTVPLFNNSTEPSEFSVNGDLFLESVKVAGEELLRIEVVERFLDIKTSTFKWRLNLREVSEFPAIPEVTFSAEIDRAEFLKAIRFCEGFMGEDVGDANKYGMAFRNNKVEAVARGRSLASYSLPLGISFHASPKMIKVLEGALALSGAEKIRLGAADKVAINFGQDTMLFDEVSVPFVATTPLESLITAAAPVFKVDRETFLSSLKQIGLFGVDSKVEIERASGESNKLIIRTQDSAGASVGGRIPVSWSEGNENFAMDLRWGDLNSSFESLTTDTVDFKIGTSAGVGMYVVIEELGKLHLFSSRVEEIRVVKKKEVKKKGK